MFIIFVRRKLHLIFKLFAIKLWIDSSELKDFKSYHVMIIVKLIFWYCWLLGLESKILYESKLDYPLLDEPIVYKSYRLRVDFNVILSWWQFRLKSKFFVQRKKTMTCIRYMFVYFYKHNQDDMLTFHVFIQWDLVTLTRMMICFLFFRKRATTTKICWN